MYGVEFWAAIVLGFILGYITNWYFYRKQSKENKADSELLKQIRQYVGAEIRKGNDQNAKIVENPDGTIHIETSRNLPARITVGAEAKAEIKKSDKK